MIQNSTMRKRKVHHNRISKRKDFRRNYKLHLIGSILTFIGLLLTFIGLIIGTAQYNKNNEQQKKANTITYLQSLHELVNNTDESLLEIIKYYDIDNDINNDSISLISRDSLEKILKENHSYRKQLNDLYNGFNQFAIGCREGFFDEMTACSANGNMIFVVTKALIPYYELIEKERGYPDNKFHGCFLRVMAFRWKHDNSIWTKYNNMIKQLSEETTMATNDSMPIIRRMPDVNK